MKKLISVLFILSLVLSLAACGAGNANPGTTTAPAQNSAASDEPIVLKLGTNGKGTLATKQVDTLNAKLEEVSGGKMRIEAVLGGQLGTTAEHFAQMNEGTLDMYVGGIGDPAVAPGGTDFNVALVPFLFDSADHVHAFAESEVFQKMCATLREKTDVVPIVYLSDSCPRALSTGNKPVYSVADIKGLTLRVPTNPLQTQVWADLGTNAVQAGISELLEGLQTGRYDGHENGMDVASLGLFDYQKYYMDLNHTYQGYFLWMSGKSWDKLSEEQQGWITEAAKQASEEMYDYFWNEFYVEASNTIDQIETLERIPADQIDRQSFIDAVAEHVADYEGDYFSEGLYAEIRALAGK